MRAEPDEPALPQVDVRPERRRVLRAHAAVDAVAGDDDVGAELARRGFVVDDVLLVQQLDAERLATALQDAQQPLAADAAEAVAAGADRPPAEMDVDVVPVVERVGDLARRLRIGGFEVAERLVGEHHAPAERVVGAVALEHADVVPRAARASAAAPGTGLRDLRR